MTIQQWFKVWPKLEDQLFPPPFEAQRRLTIREYILILGFATLLFSSIGFLVIPDGFIGYDWYYYFSTGASEFFSHYPPWTVYVKWFTWPGLVGLSCAALVIALYQRYASPLVMAASFLSGPFLWLLFVAQLDGLVLLGLTGLPWLVPLATLKPQISAFAFLANRRWTIAFIGWIVLTMVVWGLWPLKMLNYQAELEVVVPGLQQPQDISLWPWSLVLAPFLLWFSRGDLDMLMTAGIFLTPHLIPYSFVVIVPAIARVPQWLALVLVAISWLCLSANWVGEWGWYLGHLFPVILWLALLQKRLRCRQLPNESV